MNVDKIRKLVRPFMSFCFVGTVVYLAITGKIKPSEILQLTGMIVAFILGNVLDARNQNNIELSRLASGSAEVVG